MLESKQTDEQEAFINSFTEEEFNQIGHSICAMGVTDFHESAACFSDAQTATEMVACSMVLMNDMAYAESIEMDDVTPFIEIDPIHYHNDESCDCRLDQFGDMLEQKSIDAQEAFNAMFTEEEFNQLGDTICSVDIS